MAAIIRKLWAVEMEKDRYYNRPIADTLLVVSESLVVLRERYNLFLVSEHSINRFEEDGLQRPNLRTLGGRPTLTVGVARGGEDIDLSSVMRATVESLTLIGQRWYPVPSKKTWTSVALADGVVGCGAGCVKVNEDEEVEWQVLEGTNASKLPVVYRDENDREFVVVYSNRQLYVVDSESGAVVRRKAFTRVVIGAMADSESGVLTVITEGGVYNFEMRTKGRGLEMRVISSVELPTDTPIKATASSDAGELLAVADFDSVYAMTRDGEVVAKIPVGGQFMEAIAVARLDDRKYVLATSVGEEIVTNIPIANTYVRRLSVYRLDL